MASIVNIPFNFQPPISPSLKTTSYTVPAGKYVRAVLSYTSPSIYAQTAGVYNYNNYVSSLVQISAHYISLNGTPIFYQKNINVRLTDYSSPYTGQVHGFRFPSYFGGEMLLSAYHTTATASNYYVAIDDGTTGGTFSPIALSQPANTIVSRRVGVSKGGGFSIHGGSGVYTYGVLANIEAVAHNMPDTIEVWLKAGDVLDGLGPWQAIITEYNAIG